MEANNNNKNRDNQPNIITIPDSDEESTSTDDDDEQTSSSSQPTSPTSAGSAKSEILYSQSRLCEMCQLTAAKYTCPGCSRKTCSALCVSRHKLQFSCTGERNKTEFVSMQEYTDSDLLNDYRFLEDAERKLYSNQTVPLNRKRAILGASFHLNKRSKLLMNAAYKRGIKLKMVSPALTKNKSNTSFYTISTDTIGWHIDWIFAATHTVIRNEKTPETTTLLEAARKHVNFVQYPHLRKSLAAYKNDKLELARFFLKVEGLPANRERYFELKPTSTIADSLRGHCLTEYPTIVVVASGGGDDHTYTLLSKDDLPEMEKDNVKHLAKHFPELDMQAAIEEVVLNPKSFLFSGF